MAKFGTFLLCGFLLVVMGRILKPAMDGLFPMMNASAGYNLTVAESVLWRGLPYIIPAILFGILIAYLTGRIGGSEG